nr:unnamed protein product [Callosobruchus analis]
MANIPAKADIPTCLQIKQQTSYWKAQHTIDIFDSEGSMVPYSEEEAFKMRKFSFLDEPSSKDKQRPPIYNPEDYATLLRKWGKKTATGLQSLYSNASTPDLDCTKSKISIKDYRNPMLTGSEMTLRQFGSVSELLAKLKSDLKMAYPSFIQEFVGDPLDGVTLLLDLLRAVQLSQSAAPVDQSNAMSAASMPTKVPPALQRRALLDELACLQCLHACCTRYSEAVRKLTLTSAGLFTLAICIMSNVNKSRTLALQLLRKACDPPTNGHSAVAEAMSTLRLRFGEPNLARNITQDQSLHDEIRRWEEGNIDIEAVYDKLRKCETEAEKLRAKVVHLEQRIKYLQEEQLALQNSRQTLKDRCSELQVEVQSLKSEKSHKKSTCSSRQKGNLTPEDEHGQHSMYTSTFIPGNVVSSVASRKSEEEEETTIDDVIEELRNIVNDAETASYNEEQSRILEERKRTEEAQVAGKLLSSLDVNDGLVSAECEIVPSNLHPQPPRKVKSLMQLFHPAEEFDYCRKELFCENDTSYTTDDGSGSILSLTRYLHPSLVERNQPVAPQVVKPKTRSSVKRSESFRQVTRTTSRRISCDVYNYSTTITKHKESSQIPQDCVPGKYKCKSMDRIDDGLEALVDIVVTKEGEQKSHQKSSAYRSKSDSGNASGTSLCRSLSNVFVSPRIEHVSKLSTHSEEKQKMFLPMKSDQYEVPYYLPRIQEKKTSSSSSGFLIKRGHGNAGLYSGQVLLDSRLFMTKEKEVITLSGKINGKLSDFPSGLY